MIDPDKYRRSVPLHCPTCARTSFDADDAAQGSDMQRMTCEGCGRVLTRQELLDANAENVQAHVDEIKGEVVEDIRKKLAGAFKGLKFK